MGIVWVVRALYQEWKSSHALQRVGVFGGGNTAYFVLLCGLLAPDGG